MKKKFSFTPIVFSALLLCLTHAGSACAEADTPSLPLKEQERPSRGERGVRIMEQPVREGGGTLSLPGGGKQRPGDEARVLPPLDRTDDAGTQLAEISSVFVSRYHFSGNTVFADDELTGVAAPYTGRRVSFEELEELRHLLTLYYVERGYRNSGAVLPDQKIGDGTVTFQIIEGRLDKITISGTEKIRPAYLCGRLAGEEGEPLNILTLQERVQLLHLDPLIKKINAVLTPGAGLGEADLKVSVEENPPYQFGLRFNNSRPPSVGSERFEINGAHHNLTGWGDSFLFRYGLAEGQDDYSLSYALPVNRYDTTLKLFYSRNDSNVIEQPFDRIDIESESETYGVSLSHPVLKKPGRESRLGLGIERRTGETFLLGRPFSFTEGTHDGRSELTVVRFSQDWLERTRSQVIAARSVLSFGLKAFEATENPSGPDADFFTWLVQFQWARRFEEIGDSQLLFRLDCQFTEDSLFPLEQFAVGGMYSVRGYRENQLVRDRGLVTSLEWRIPLGRLPVPQISRAEEDGLLQFAPFWDWGWGENAGRTTPLPRTISSVGAGLRWTPSAKLSCQLYYGYGLRDMDSGQYDLQDDGIHFNVSWNFF